jgi:hypothetical protein
MARTFSGTFLPANPSGAAHADAGDCFSGANDGIYCLPGLVNIGVQKAGTGELQTWLDKHPSVIVHGGEVHFFDKLISRHPSKCTQRIASTLRLRYARFLWRKRHLLKHELPLHVLFEKTPAYFDRIRPETMSCALPSARLLLMLRDPTERARSAYSMCQREMQAEWCRDAFDQVLGRVLTSPVNGSSPALNLRTLRGEHHLRRMFLMGHYVHFVKRWLRAFHTSQIRVLWLEQFKVDPFACMAAVERFSGLRAYDYKSIATRNEAGLFVVGRSKSTYEKKRVPPATTHRSTPTSDIAHRAAMGSLRAYYAPWQRRLQELLEGTNMTLVHMPRPPYMIATSA